MTIDEQTYEHYWECGWTLVEGVYSGAEVDQVLQVATEISERELAQDRSRFVTDHGDDGKVAPRKISSPFLKSEAFQSFVLDPRLRGLIGDLTGQEPVLLADQIFMKPPRFGSAKPYHQDNFYFRCEPADHVLTAWIALDDVDVANGCLRYIEGSHKGEVLPHDRPDPDEPYNLAPPAELIDLSKEALACVKRGGVVFHHVKTLHTSHQNESERWRRAYATHWASAATGSEKDTVAAGYFNREDYPRVG